jgi:hypothetical protein
MLKQEKKIKATTKKKKWWQKHQLGQDLKVRIRQED